MFPTVVAVVLTVAFVATGVYALARYVRLASDRGPGRDAGGQARAVELLHLLMSLAMIAMAWGWSGGPDTGSGVVQLVVFGAFALVFAVLAARARGVASVLSRAAHALMAAAMVWMVAAMPLLMGHGARATGAAEAGGHAGHGAAATDTAGMAGMDMSGGMAGTTAGGAPAPAPNWAIVVNTVLAVLLAVAAVRWALGAVRAGRARVLAAQDHGCDDVDGPAAPASSAGAGPVAVLAAPVDVVARRAALTQAVLAASCHTVMSLGMAAMLLAMA